LDWVCPEILEGLPASVFQSLSQLIRGGGVFWPGKGKIPVEVRVLQLPREIAGMAFLTGPSDPRAFAKEQTRQPES
jgi:hypothetical protein